MNLSPAARVYAEAMLQIGQGRGALDLLVGEVRAMATIVASDPRARSFLDSPAIDRKAKKAALARAFSGKIDPAVANLMAVLVDRGRQALLGEIASALEARADEVSGRLEAEVLSAVPMPPPIAARVKRVLDAGTGLDVRVKDRVDPEVLGGLVIRVRDIEADGSLRRTLLDVRRRLRRRPIDPGMFVDGG